METLVAELSQLTDEAFKTTYLRNADTSELYRLKLYLDDIYYNSEQSSPFNDSRYDMIKGEIVTRNPDYIPEVGAKVRETDTKVTLPFWLGSMDKIKGDDLDQWLYQNQTEDYIIMDKLDGMCCLLEYTSTHIKMYKRGNGRVGSDISHLIDYIGCIPKNITTFPLFVRGELIISKDKFRRYNTEFVNSRNMVSGVVNSKTLRHGVHSVDLVVYESPLNDLMLPLSVQLDRLEELGFNVVYHTMMKSVSIDKLTDLLQIRKDRGEYEIDGLIVQPNVEYYRTNIGNPSYSIAFKVNTTVITTVEDVEWSVSKHSVLKPRVRITPVFISGATITYASGFNAGFIVKNGIGKGATIEITRSGEVIPYILNVITSSNVDSLPDLEFHWNDTGVDIIADEQHHDIRVKEINNFMTCTGVKNVSEGTIVKLLDSGFDSIPSILSASVSDFETVPTIKRKSAERVYNEIHKSMENIDMVSLMAGSNAFGFGIGKKKLKQVLLIIPDLLSRENNNDLYNEILGIEGFSDKTTDRIVSGLDKFIEFNNELKKLGIFGKTENNQKSLHLKNQKFVLSGFRDRRTEEMIEQHGGKVMTSVSSKTSGVIVSNVSVDTVKTKKARLHGIPLYTRAEFDEKFLQ